VHFYWCEIFNKYYTNLERSFGVNPNILSDLLLSLLSLILCIAELNLTKFGRVGPWEEEFQNCSNEVDIQWGCMVV
jgi:hypothetical protein